MIVLLLFIWFLVWFGFACILIQKKIKKKKKKVITPSVPVRQCPKFSDTIDNCKHHKYNRITLNTIEGIVFHILKISHTLNLFYRSIEI